jgi:hypothetical protein
MAERLSCDGIATMTTPDCSTVDYSVSALPGPTIA